MLKLYLLQDGNYKPVERSELPGLTELDLNLLMHCILMAETEAEEAIRVFRREM